MSKAAGARYLATACEPLPNWFGAKVAAGYVDTCTKTIYREVAAGRLRAARIGGRTDLRFKREWLDEWLEASAAPVEVTPHNRAAWRDRDAFVSR